VFYAAITEISIFIGLVLFMHDDGGGGGDDDDDDDDDAGVETGVGNVGFE